MNRDEFEFCKIFVKCGVENVTAMIATLFGGRFERRSMFLPGLVIDVRPNSDGVPADELTNEFVRWPTLVEMELAEGGSGDLIFEATARALTELWNSDCPAVAACDFEADLPWSGGIGRLRQ